MRNSLEYEIRAAAESDIDVILALMAASASRLPSPDWYVTDDRDFLLRHIHTSGFTLVATRGGHIAGFLVVRFPGFDADNLGAYLTPRPAHLLHVAHMESAAVHPDDHGHGLQRKLLRAAEAALAATQYLHLMVTVHPDNRYSASNLQQLGYHEIARVQKYGGLSRAILYKQNPHALIV